MNATDGDSVQKAHKSNSGVVIFWLAWRSNGILIASMLKSLNMCKTALQASTDVQIMDVVIEQAFTTLVKDQ